MGKSTVKKIKLNLKKSNAGSQKEKITNLNDLAKPFKNKKFTMKKKTKPLKSVLILEKSNNLNTNNYITMEAGPSIKPIKKYCDLTGLLANYNDPKTQLRYFGVEQFKIIKQMNLSTPQDYLSVRNANVVLR
ncbi:hypothetical protein CONCODRAFT_80463 [Conidiobolus coronatus NRRL 28638]|uniref:Vps72/YL1 C-terminal domain-containing protein n=1 Tax=Conidiobolus coronatus (strain ATCC 28846 / CBS 209.66 / NRRL 28638) TaxID=796925 RepID=A0A137NUU5_CONC2|nr:hypothetical protein CONCODRAFT_80463 [Conidiobolus coronatus NRRL 28638]|eukprot:KXN66529.1 hypothetical protein CONCODRAFT_80463 [Conidiobolus coronatus NRRL 28638]